MKTHELKILREFAEASYKGLKPWEIRKNDRDFKVGDTIKFITINEQGQEIRFPYYKKITYVFTDTSFGLQEGYCILTLEKL